MCAMVKAPTLEEEDRRREEALRLADSVDLSDLSSGSRQVRARALAWCARILSTGDTLPRAKAFLAKSKELAPSPEASLAEAFIIASTDKPTALAYLSSLGTPSAMAAALRICISADGPEAAFDWTKRAGLDEGSFDAEGKYSYLAVALQIGRWDELFRGAKTVTELEIAELAPLLYTVAMARMLCAVPVELCALPIGSIAADACVLFLWSTAPTMSETFGLLKEWGFSYRSQCIWAKDKFGLGFWFRNQHEILIVAIKGKVPLPRMARNGRASSKPRAANIPRSLPSSTSLSKPTSRPCRRSSCSPAARRAPVGTRGGTRWSRDDLPHRRRLDWSRQGIRWSIRVTASGRRGQSKPCWTPFPISTIIVSRTGE